MQDFVHQQYEPEAIEEDVLRGPAGGRESHFVGPPTPLSRFRVLGPGGWFKV